MSSFEENLKRVYDSFNLTNLDESTINMLSQFMDAYHQILQEHLNSEYELKGVAERLKKLTGPVQKALNTPDDGNLHPAADFIKTKLAEQAKEMEKPFRKVLTTSNAPALVDPNEHMNGFSLSIIIVCFTIVLGMVLGALLFVIK